MLYYPRSKRANEYIVPNTVHYIKSVSFYQNVFLKNLKFSGKLNEVILDAVYTLEEVEYPVITNYPSDYVVRYCPNLTKIVIGKEVSFIPDNEFSELTNATLYVYNNSYALNWAKEHDFAYVIMEETPIEKDLVDEGTGIKVKGTMDPDAALKVEKLENTFENSVATYDITLQKDGIAIQPDGAITIKIPSDVKDCKVMWLKDDGTAEDMNAKYTDGCYVFTTDHLSVYALVQDKTILTGDANQDGIVNVNDVTYLQMHIAGNKNTDGSAFIDETNKLLFDCIDMNKDGKLSVADVTALQIHISQNN